MQGVIKKWGNSLAIVLPSKEIKKMDLKINELVTFSLVREEENPLQDLWDTSELDGVSLLKELKKLRQEGKVSKFE